MFDKYTVEGKGIGYLQIQYTKLEFKRGALKIIKGIICCTVKIVLFGFDLIEERLSKTLTNINIVRKTHIADHSYN